MRSGRKGEERRECILNSTPLESCFVFLYFIIREIRGGERRESILNSPSRIFFCFSYFILRKLRGEGRRGFILNSTPLESSFVFLFHYSKIRGVAPFVLAFEAFQAPFVLTFEAFVLAFEAFEAPFVLTLRSLRSPPPLRPRL